MFKITIPGEELWDESTNTFVDVKETTLELEHSLASLSKWESIFRKPFLLPGEKTNEEILGYIEAMIVSGEIPPEGLKLIDKHNLEIINDYINTIPSATTFYEPKQSRGRSETITSELIYFWMVSYNVPFECQYWNINRLFALLRICNIKNTKEKKMSRGELAARNRELNAQRKAQLGTSG